jgi:hypothetical protein
MREVQASGYIQEKLINSMTDGLLERALAGNKLHGKDIIRVNEDNLWAWRRQLTRRTILMRSRVLVFGNLLDESIL